MNKTTLLQIALWCSLFSFAQNIDTTKYKKVTPTDTIKNYYNQNNNNNTPNDTIKNYYPPQNNQQQDANQQPKEYQPDKSYPYRNQKGNNKTRSNTQKQQNPSESEFIKNLYYGAYIYFAGGAISGYSLIYYELSPHVGYKFNDVLSGGVQILYNGVVESGGSRQPVSYSVIGGGVFARAAYKFVFAQVEYDVLAVPSGYLGNVIIKRSASEEKMAGLGIRRTYGKLSLYGMFMYDFGPTTNSPYYYNPLVYRIGFSYNW
jgi:hypothetical protein